MLGVWWGFIMDKEWICALTVKLLKFSRNNNNNNNNNDKYYYYDYYY